MLMAEIRGRQAIFDHPAVVNGNWAVINISTGISWPVNVQVVRYRDEDILILPLTTETQPAVALDLRGRPRNDGYKLLMRFLSALSWSESGGILVSGMGGGNLPRPGSREREYGYTITTELNLDYLPEPADERALVALALMREGRGLQHAPYSFLSFYRALERAIPKGPARGRWIEDHIDRLEDRRANEALAELKATGVEDAAEHLYRSGRQAVAHAGGTDGAVVDPDDPADDQRLRRELPIMERLAELAVEQVLGVQTRHTQWREHLYELAGFRRVLGPELVQRICDGNPPEKEVQVDMPAITVELQGKEPYPALADLQPVYIGMLDRSAEVIWRSKNALVQFRLEMDFNEERLLYDLAEGLQLADDGSLAAAEALFDATRFNDEYFGNGRLRITNAETGEELSRVDAFLPLNMMRKHGWWEEESARLQAEIAKRRAEEAARGDVEVAKE